MMYTQGRKPGARYTVHPNVEQSQEHISTENLQPVRISFQNFSKSLIFNCNSPGNPYTTTTCLFN